MSEGDTIEEALANIKEALDGVIETMIDHNISLHTNKQGNIIGFHTKIEASLEQAKKDYKA
jgi:predicted RNase H-like HicB family nuclease